MRCCWAKSSEGENACTVKYWGNNAAMSVMIFLGIFMLKEFELIFRVWLVTVELPLLYSRWEGWLLLATGEKVGVNCCDSKLDNQANRSMAFGCARAKKGKQGQESLSCHDRRTDHAGRGLRTCRRPAVRLRALCLRQLRPLPPPLASPTSDPNKSSRYSSSPSPPPGSSSSSPKNFDIYCKAIKCIRHKEFWHDHKSSH